MLAANNNNGDRLLNLGPVKILFSFVLNFIFFGKTKVHGSQPASTEI